MADDWTDWADGSDLASMSRSSAPLAAAGYDPDELRANPGKASAALSQLSGPYKAASDERNASAQAVQIAQATPPPTPEPAAPAAAPQPAAADPDPRFQDPPGSPARPVLHTRPQPGQPAAPPPETLGPAATAPDPAAPNPNPSNPAAPAPAGAAPWAGYAQKGLEGELSIADQNRQAFQAEPAAPDTTAIDTKIETDSIPTNPRATDPVTGKPLYKDSFGGTVGRVFKNFAEGFGGHPDQATPYGSPNKDYTEDEQLRQGTLAQDQQRKADIIARFNAATSAIRDKGKDLQTVAPDYAHVGTTAADLVKTQATADQNTPEAKAAVKTAETNAEWAAKYKQWDAEATRLGLKGQYAAFYRANGRLFDPRQATAEETARAQALRAWERDPANRGKQPTLDDLNQINQVAGGREKEPPSATPPDTVKAAADDGMSKITEFTSTWKRQPNGNYRTTVPGKFDSITGTEYDAKVTKLRQDANAKLAKDGWMIDPQGQLVQSPAAAAATSRKAPRQPAPEGLRRQAPDGHIEVKRGGKWVAESRPGQ
jgi:hypothetical protein